MTRSYALWVVVLVIGASGGCKRADEAAKKAPETSAVGEQREAAKRKVAEAAREKQQAARSCAESQGCLLGGRCTVLAQRCVAGSDEDCRRSRGCKDDGVCVARDGDCHRSCDDDGWCTVFELGKPREGAWLGSMWASGPSDIFAVGRFAIVHYDGLRWQLQANHATSAIYDISGSGPDDVYVVGSWRTFQRYDGKSWRLEHKDTFGTIRTTHVNGVMVFAPGKACATSGNYSFWCREADGKWARIRSRKRRKELTKAFEQHGGRKKAPAEATIACAPKGVAGVELCGTPDSSVVKCEDGRGFVLREVGKQKQTTPLGKLPAWFMKLPLRRECVVTGDWIYANDRTRIFRHHLDTKK